MLLLQFWQERISTRIRAAAMGIEGTDMRDNRKEELTTDRFGGEAWEGERSNNNREILSLDGREDGDTINKSRLQRKSAGLRGKMTILFCTH